VSICRTALATVALAALAAAPARGAVDPKAAAAVFQEAKTLCTRDHGVFWGRSLCGPIMLVDPNDRGVTANQADPGQVLKEHAGVFTGVLPPAVDLADTPTEWSGLLWTQLLWPLSPDTEQRHVTLAHELFHRIQPELKLSRPEVGNRHLDTLEGRYLLQLEWRGLAKALEARAPADRKAALVDALLFRRERHHLFADAAVEEASLEVAEGVPEYTGVMLGLVTPQSRTKFAIRDLSAFVQSPSFVRSFAYACGPAYGLLLDQAAPGWRQQLHSGRGLGDLLAATVELPATVDLKARVAVYDDGTLRAAEEKREQDRRAREATLRAKLVDGPVLILPLLHARYQFNPQTLLSLGDDGTVYPTLRLTCDWGVLEVDNGALFGKDMSEARVSAAGVDPAAPRSADWRLVLKDGWTVQRGARDGDLVVKASR